MGGRSTVAMDAYRRGDEFVVHFDDAYLGDIELLGVRRPDLDIDIAGRQARERTTSPQRRALTES